MYEYCGIWPTRLFLRSCNWTPLLITCWKNSRVTPHSFRLSFCRSGAQSLPSYSNLQQNITPKQASLSAKHTHWATVCFVFRQRWCLVDCCWCAGQKRMVMRSLDDRAQCELIKKAIMDADSNTIWDETNKDWLICSFAYTIGQTPVLCGALKVSQLWNGQPLKLATVG